MNLEEQVVKKLIEKGMVISTAESCTGGLVASTIVNVPGSSACFYEGYITYSNEAKIRLLGVKEESVKAFGVVSDQVVREMAEGVLLKTGSDIAVSVSGIAGPGGGSKEKPVGTVYVGFAIKQSLENTETFAYQHYFTGTREEIRKQTVKEVLKMILNAI